MTRDRLPLSVVVAAPSEAPGVEALLEAAAAEARGGAPVRAMLTDRGLSLLTTAWPGRLHAAGVDVAICSRSAREQGVAVGGVPAGVRWSSLTAFLRDDGGTRLWTAFP